MGVGPATIYRYFETKAELAVSAGISYWQKVTDKYVGALSGENYMEKDGSSQLQCIFRIFEEIFREERLFLGFLQEFDIFVRKYQISKENIYYFLRGGYHVFMPEHCGHGRSYRMCSDTGDLSLVHVNDYKRYVDDLLFVSRRAAAEFPELPVYLYGHSMGGGIAAAAAAQAPGVFDRMILSSPMIRPSSEPVPWCLACLIAAFYCIVGKKEQYVLGNQPYSGPERFADSASVSEARFDYYQKKRSQEPLFQINAASYGWLWQAVRLNHYLQKKAWREITCPVLVFQAECDTYVSKTEQERFARKLSHRRKGGAKLVRVSGVKHEIFNAGTETLERYWFKALDYWSAKRT